MKLLNIFLLIFSLLVISACKKQHNISIQANDLNNGSVNAYANMPFLISQSRPAWFEDKVDKVYEGFLDDNGFASFDLKMQKDWSYILSVGQPENICYGGLIGFYLENEKSNVVSFSYAKCGELKFSYKNANCIDANDHIEVSRYNEINGYAGFLINAEYEGCADYTMENFVEVPMGWWYFEWEVTKNNTTNYFSDSIFLEENEQRLYTFEY